MKLPREEKLKFEITFIKNDHIRCKDHFIKS